MTVAEARRVLFEQECEALINQEKVNAAGHRAGREPGHHLPRRDRQGRGQRGQPRGRRLAAGRAARPAADRRGHDRADQATATCETDHILFIAAGAFHRAKPSDLMPELQGRFPIRVELQGPDQGRLRPHPDRAEERADQAVHGAAGDRRRRARVHATTRSTRWPATPSR